MGLLLLLKNTANGYKWALCFYKELLLMPFDGPLSLPKMLQKHLHGPIIIPADNFTDSHEWALCFYDEILPLPLDGPIVVAEIATNGHEWPSVLARKAADTLAWAPVIAAEQCYRWLQMGLLFLTRKVANTPARAHYCCS